MERRWGLPGEAMGGQPPAPPPLLSQGRARRAVPWEVGTRLTAASIRTPPEAPSVPFASLCCCLAAIPAASAATAPSPAFPVRGWSPSDQQRVRKSRAGGGAPSGARCGAWEVGILDSWGARSPQHPRGAADGDATAASVVSASSATGKLGTLLEEGLAPSWALLGESGTLAVWLQLLSSPRPSPTPPGRGGPGMQ